MRVGEEKTDDPKYGKGGGKRGIARCHTKEEMPRRRKTKGFGRL